MRCHQCGAVTDGTETHPGTISSICPPCNVKLTGLSHHPQAAELNARGVLISASGPDAPTTVAAVVDTKPRRRVKSA